MSLCFDKLCRTCMTEAHAMLPIYEKDGNGLILSSSTHLDMLQAFTALRVFPIYNYLLNYILCNNYTL